MNHYDADSHKTPNNIVANFLLAYSSVVSLNVFSYVPHDYLSPYAPFAAGLNFGRHPPSQGYQLYFLVLGYPTSTFTYLPHPHFASILKVCSTLVVKFPPFQDLLSFFLTFYLMEASTLSRISFFISFLYLRKFSIFIKMVSFHVQQHFEWKFFLCYYYLNN